MVKVVAGRRPTALTGYGKCSSSLRQTVLRRRHRRPTQGSSGVS